jgi:hypothetical protein
MIWIMLSENFHRTFAADDVDQSPIGIIKNVVSVTNRGQTVTIARKLYPKQPGLTPGLAGRFLIGALLTA